MIYFSEKEGITSTSANYLANLAKECIRKNEAKLTNITFVDKHVELITGDKKMLRRGWTSLAAIPQLINEISEMNAFIAWIREAIKAKEMLLDTLRKLTLDGYCILKGIEKPQPPEPLVEVIDNDVIQEMDIKEKNNYLRLEAFAATLGKYIHPDGHIASAREDVLYREQVPNEVSGEGRDMVIYSYTPSVLTSDVNSMFMELQNTHRNYERQLNAIKYNIKEEVSKRNVAKSQEYKVAFQKYSSATQEIRQEMNIYVNEERNRIANLKIVIPEKLKGTYEYLNSLG